MRRCRRRNQRDSPSRRGKGFATKARGQGCFQGGPSQGGGGVDHSSGSFSVPWERSRLAAHGSRSQHNYQEVTGAVAKPEAEGSLLASASQGLGVEASHSTRGNRLGSANLLASASEWPKRQVALRTICVAFFLVRVLALLGEGEMMFGLLSTLSESMSLYRKINRQLEGRETYKKSLNSATQ